LKQYSQKLKKTKKIFAGGKVPLRKIMLKKISGMTMFRPRQGHVDPGGLSRI